MAAWEIASPFYTGDRLSVRLELYAFVRLCILRMGSLASKLFGWKEIKNGPFFVCNGEHVAFIGVFTVIAKLFKQIYLFSKQPVWKQFEARLNAIIIQLLGCRYATLHKLWDTLYTQNPPSNLFYFVALSVDPETQTYPSL